MLFSVIQKYFSTLFYCVNCILLNCQLNNCLNIVRNFFSFGFLFVCAHENWETNSYFTCVPKLSFYLSAKFLDITRKRLIIVVHAGQNSKFISLKGHCKTSKLNLFHLELVIMSSSRSDCYLLFIVLQTHLFKRVSVSIEFHFKNFIVELIH